MIGAAGIVLAWLLPPMRLALKISAAPGEKATKRAWSGWNLRATPQTAAEVPDSMRIPKILHQTYKSADLPPGFQRFRQSWLEWTPSWRHRFWQDSDLRALVAEHYPRFLHVYDSYEENIQRVDAARVFIMHRYGGVYADLDIEVLQDPLPLFDGGQDLAFFYDWTTWEWQNTSLFKSGITNGIMASIPGHPFWIELAKRMMSVHAKAKELTIPDHRIFYSTGPAVFTMQVEDYMQKYPVAKVAVFPRKFWSPVTYNVEHDPCDDTPRCRAAFPCAILVSHWTGSWRRCTDGITGRINPAFEKAFCTQLHRREPGAGFEASEEGDDSC